MTKKYYTLRYEHDDAFHKAGEKVFNDKNTLHIGQTESCDIRLSNSSQYEDAVIAIIEKRTDDKGWKLIRISPFTEHEVRVNAFLMWSGPRLMRLKSFWAVCTTASASMP